MKCAAPFFSSRLSKLWSHISIPLCSKLKYCEDEVFFTLLNYYAFIAFWITFLPQFVKRKDGHLLLSMSSNSKVFTFDHLLMHSSFRLLRQFHHWQFLWLNGQNTVKTDAWGLHFRERVEKMKENGKNRKPTKWAGKIWREKNSRTCTFGAKIEKYYIFFKF